MKSVLFFSALLLTLITQSQVVDGNKVYKVLNDTIYQDQVEIGIIKRISEKKTEVLVTEAKYVAGVKAQSVWALSETQKFGKLTFIIDKFLFYPEVEVNESEILTLNGDQIATITIQDLPKYHLIEVFPNSKRYFDFLDIKVRVEIEKFFKFRNSGKQSEVHIKYDFDNPLFTKDNSTKDNRHSLDEKLSSYYTNLEQRLKADLDEIEGVYSSIDIGLEYEFDVVLLIDEESPNQYQAYIVSSTDPEFLPDLRGILFTLRKTAVENKFLISFSLKSGVAFNKKLAAYRGGIIEFELYSFIKMYPNQTSLLPRFQEDKFEWDSSGSGFFFNQDGYIITNNHVIEKGARIEVVQSTTGQLMSAKIVATDAQSDLALLKIDMSIDGVENLYLGDQIKMGQNVFTLGYPISNAMGENIKLSNGVVSGETGRGGRLDYFQTTMPVRYGNSGGACYNFRGELIGVISEIQFDKGVKLEGVSYASGIENLRSLLSNNGLEVYSNAVVDNLPLEVLIEKYKNNNVFIKVYYNE